MHFGNLPLLFSTIILVFLMLMHQSIPGTNIPPGRPLGFCTLLLPRGRDLYLMTLPGGRFLHIHKITFSTVKSILSLNWHLDHTSMRFIGRSAFNIKTIRTFGLKDFTVPVHVGQFISLRLQRALPHFACILKKLN